MGVDLWENAPTKGTLVAKDFTTNSLLKSSTDYNYLPAFTAGNTMSNSPFVTRSAELYRSAGSAMDKQENAALGISAPLSAADFTALAQLHNSLALAHQKLAEDMKAASPTTNIKAISANGDAYGAHLDAAKRCLQSVAGTKEAIDFATDNRNQNSNSDRDATHAPENIPAKDAWLGAHRAFVMSRYAHNEAIAALAAAVTMGGLNDVAPLPYSVNQSTTAY
jgi:hypothetical protein